MGNNLVPKHDLANSNGSALAANTDPCLSTTSSSHNNKTISNVHSQSESSSSSCSIKASIMSNGHTESKTETSTEKEYDFYVVFNKNDYDNAWALCQQIEKLDKKKDGQQLKGYFEPRDGMLGQSKFTNIGRALDLSRKVLVLISENSLCRQTQDLKAQDRDGRMFQFIVHTTLQICMDDFTKNPDASNFVVPIFVGISPNDAPSMIRNVYGVDMRQNNPFRSTDEKLRVLFDTPLKTKRSISTNNGASCSDNNNSSTNPVASKMPSN